MIRSDGTAECDECGLPMFPYERTPEGVRLECANRHHGIAPPPRDPATLRLVDGWIAKRGAQLHAQHERWGTDDLKQGEEK